MRKGALRPYYYYDDDDDHSSLLLRWWWWCSVFFCLGRMGNMGLLLLYHVKCTVVKLYCMWAEPDSVCVCVCRLLATGQTQSSRGLNCKRCTVLRQSDCWRRWEQHSAVANNDHVWTEGGLTLSRLLGHPMISLAKCFLPVYRMLFKLASVPACREFWCVTMLSKAAFLVSMTCSQNCLGRKLNPECTVVSSERVTVFCAENLELWINTET